ncbi:MAG: HAD family phosphatase [Lachnospiraceae bacterium]|nr:HAD family phosphatase [Lachnospiraceae bacterium]MBQ3980017.1 HAD family phosphatase [Lachnospiraceae bacterium]
MITAVVFDMDGILFDTERLCRDCWIALSKEFEIPNMEEVYALCIGVNVQATRQIVYDNYGKDFPFEEYDRRASAMYNEYIAEHGVPVKEGVRETLEALAKAGAKIAVASSTRREKVLRLLASAGIDRYFTAVVGGDTVKHSKPDPEIFLTACKALSVAPEEAIAVEDSHNGIRAAHAAGMLAVMVPDLLPVTEEMRKLSAYVAADMNDACGWMLRKLSK